MANGRTRLAPEERRAQLITLGVELLSTRGVDAVSVDEIAAAAGISRGLLFHYFPTKRAFHVAVLEAASADLLASLGSDEELRGSLAAWIDYVEEHRDAYLSLVRGALTADPEMHAVFERTRWALVDRVVGAIGADVPPVVPLAVRGWVGYLEDTVTTWLGDPSSTVSREDLLALLERSLVAVVGIARSLTD